MKRFGVETHYPDEGEEDPWAKAVLFPYPRRNAYVRYTHRTH